MLTERLLARATQGFDADHPDIDLLRLRNYTIGRSLSEQELLGAGGFERVAELFGAMKPFVSSRCFPSFIRDGSITACTAPHPAQASLETSLRPASPRAAARASLRFEGWLRSLWACDGQLSRVTTY